MAQVMKMLRRDTARRGGGLAALRLRAMQQVDQQAEAVRLAHLTPGAGQMWVYGEKARQAQACLQAGPAAKSQQYPLVAARAAVMGCALLEAAGQILRRYQQWVVLAAVVEREREAAKARIRLARSQKALGAIVAETLDALDMLRMAEGNEIPLP